MSDDGVHNIRAHNQRVESDGAALLKQIRQDLELGGYRAELQALHIASRRVGNWAAYSGMGFVDPETGQHRQLDLFAALIGNRLKFQLVCEVKKTEKPWVILCTQFDFYKHTFVSGSNPQVSGVATPKESPSYRFWIEKARRDAASHPELVGYAIHESFKKPADKAQSYGSLVSMAKAAEYYRTISIQGLGEADSYPRSEEQIYMLNWFFPTIVLDGPLFLAHVVDNQIVVEPATSHRIDFTYRSEKLGLGPTWIDIVALESLDAHLTHLESIHAELDAEILRELRDEAKKAQ